MRKFWENSRISRGEFQSVCNITRAQDPLKWRHVKFCVFDVPKVDLKFEERQKLLREINFPSHVRVCDVMETE